MTKNIFILGLFVACLWQLVSSYSKSCSSSIVNKTNLKTDYLAGGRVLRFSCPPSFVLVGKSFVACNKGELSDQPPSCGKNNCNLLLDRLPHINMQFWYSGAVLTFTCNPNLDLIGSSTLLCTENGWNDSVPVCQAKSLLQFSVCDFEPKENDQCNWVSSFSGRWEIMSTESNLDRMGKYAVYDHTLGPHTGGHYLYWDNLKHSNLRSTFIAKFESPMFPPILSNPHEEWCLVFFIHLFGSSAGNVEVKINNDTAWKSDELLRSNNNWSKVTINLTHLRTPFRIIIIGNQKSRPISNAAIDDIRITNGSDCLTENDEISSSTSTSSEYSTISTSIEYSTISASISTFTEDPTFTDTLETSSSEKIDEYRLIPGQETTTNIIENITAPWNQRKKSSILSNIKKTMVYAVAVVISTIVVIIVLAIRRHRNRNGFEISDNNVIPHEENVAFLSEIELINKY